MSTDEADPSCPECGEPIGRRASYCMHCGAEFGDAEGEFDDAEAEVGGGDADTEDGGLGGTLGSVVDAVDGTSARPEDVDYDPAEVPDETGEADTASEADTAGRADATGGADASGGTTAAGGAGAAGGADASGGEHGTSGAGTAADETGLLHPDGLLDNSLTVVVGIVAGIVIGVISLFVFGIAFGGTGVLLAFVAWLGSTAYLARRRTVFDAVRDGAFGLAAVLVIAGIGASVGTAMDGGSAVAAIVVLVPFLFVAALVAGTGYAIGTFGVE